MRVKTSVTLPQERPSRTDAMDEMERQQCDRRDQQIINRRADRLNREAMDTLEYQRLP